MSKVNQLILQLERASGDGRQLDPVVGLPDGEIAVCAQYITGNSKLRRHSLAARHAVQRQVAEDLDAVICVCKDGSALEDDLRTSNRLHQLLACTQASADTFARSISIHLKPNGVADFTQLSRCPGGSSSQMYL